MNSPLQHLPPEPDAVSNTDSRLRRVETKLNVLIGLVAILTLYPIVGWVFGLVQTSGWILLILLAIGLVLVMLRERIPGVLKRSARWLVMKALNTDEKA